MVHHQLEGVDRRLADGGRCRVVGKVDGQALEPRDGGLGGHNLPERAEDLSDSPAGDRPDRGALVVHGGREGAQLPLEQLRHLPGGVLFDSLRGAQRRLLLGDGESIDQHVDGVDADGRVGRAERPEDCRAVQGQEQVVDPRLALLVVETVQHPPQGLGQGEAPGVQCRGHQAWEHVMLEPVQAAPFRLLPCAVEDLAVGLQHAGAARGDLVPNDGGELADQVGVEVERVGQEPAPLCAPKKGRVERAPQKELLQVLDARVLPVQLPEAVAGLEEPLHVHGPAGGHRPGEQERQVGDQPLLAFQAPLPPQLAHACGRLR